VSLNLEPILNEIVDSRLKGFPHASRPMPLRDIGNQGWNVLRGDMPFPLAVVKRSAMSHNSSWMRDFARSTGVAIAPHGKTTMCPQIFARQLEDGAWGMTVANVHQLGICVGIGIRRVLIANQVVARAIAASAAVQLCGIECYEGLAVTGDSERDQRHVDALVESVHTVAVACDREGLFAPGEVILSAGGSAVFDIVARDLPLRLSRPVRTILRSGCYVTHDSGTYERLFERVQARSSEHWQSKPGLRPALEVWSLVQSRPESGLAILTMGRRDVSYDIEMPRPLKWFREGTHAAPQCTPTDWQVQKLNDQHAYLQLPDGADLNVGDLVGCGISHPCTTFDKWQLLLDVDDDYTVVDALRTFF
jgi:D-serine dehydratase